MYSVDDTVKALALAPARHIYSMAIFGSKSGTTWDNDRTYSDTDSLISAKIDIGSSSGGLTIGAAYSAKLTLKLMGDVTVNQTDRIIMRVGFYNSDGTKSDKIGLGWFYVDTITRKDKLTTVVAYDKMLRGAKNYKPTALTFPCRLSEVLADVCDKMDVTIRDDVTLPYDPIINSAPVKGTDSDGNTLYYTRREMLGYIGSLMGGNWFFDAGGHLAFTQFAEVSDTFAAANSTAADISEEAYSVNGITWNINGVAYSRFDEDTAGMLEFSNPLDVDAKEPIMGAVEKRLVGLTYHGGTIQRQGCGWFELGDIVTSDRKDGTTAPVLITGIGYTISGGAFTEKIYSSALTDSQSNYTSGDISGQTVPQSVAQEEAVNVSGGSASALTSYEYLTDLSVRFNGVTYTVEKDGTTGLISKISDSNGNEFEPNINSGITDTAFHNAVLMAVAMANGLVRGITVPGIYAEYTPDGIDIAGMKWKDNIGTNNMTLYGRPVASEGGVNLNSSDNYGKVVLDEPNTIFALFKGQKGPYSWTPVLCKGTTKGSKGGSFDIFIKDGNIAATGYAYDLISDVSSADWHVVCITRSNTKASLYIDGILVGTFTVNHSVAYAGFFTANIFYRGQYYTGESGEITLRYISFGSVECTAAQIAKKSADIIAKYGGTT